jgi:hypothetical protein
VKNGRGGLMVFFFNSVAHRRLHFVTSANFFSLFFLLFLLILPYPYRRWIDKELSLFVANLEAFFELSIVNSHHLCASTVNLPARVPTPPIFYLFFLLFSFFLICLSWKQLDLCSTFR